MQIIGKTEQKRTIIDLQMCSPCSQCSRQHPYKLSRFSTSCFNAGLQGTLLATHCEHNWHFSNKFCNFALLTAINKKKHRGNGAFKTERTPYFTTMLTSLFGTTITLTGALPSMNFFAPSVARAAFSISALSVFGSTSSLSRILPLT